MVTFWHGFRATIPIINLSCESVHARAHQAAAWSEMWLLLVFFACCTPLPRWTDWSFSSSGEKKKVREFLDPRICIDASYSRSVSFGIRAEWDIGRTWFELHTKPQQSDQTPILIDRSRDRTRSLDEACWAVILTHRAGKMQDMWPSCPSAVIFFPSVHKPVSAWSYRYFLEWRLTRTRCRSMRRKIAGPILPHAVRYTHPTLQDDPAQATSTQIHARFILRNC